VPDAPPVGDAAELRRAAFAGLVLLVLFNVADVVLTEMLLRRGGLELNPVADYLLSSRLALVVKLIIVGALFVDVWRRGIRVITLCLLWLVVGVYFTVVVVNGSQLVAVRDS
jgi:hypothetical protein